MVGETLLKDEHVNEWADVNGLSVSPKKAFNIVKIWLGSEKLSDPGAFNLPPKYASSAMFTNFRSHIQATKAR
jgi:hypothetical protein